MLRTLLPGIPQRYAFVGSAIGALLPVIGVSTEFFLSGGDVSVLARLGDPAHALLLTAPLVTGLISYHFGQVVWALGIKLKARERTERHLVNLSLHDRLTGLPNRFALEKEIDRFIETRKQDDSRPALLLLDLNKFKYVNDTLGHDAGDELLRIFTGRLKQALGPLVRLFRLGGDEFVITLGGRPTERDIERLCRVIEARCDEPFLLTAGRAVTGVSIGIAFLETEDRAMGEVLKRADLALYIAKDVPGSSHAFHTEGLGRFMEAQAALEHEIGLALETEQFFLEYQPIVNAVGNQVQAFEALVRWRHPDRGVVMPDSFLPMAVHSGHIASLGRWVVGRALGDAASWPEAVGVAINVSAEELRDPGFIDHIGDCLDASGVTPSRLTIEVTEAAFAADVGSVGLGLSDLRQLGVRIALDDFGLGLSSINLLRSFPVDVLKVDRSFTRAMLEDGRECELVDIIVKLGRAFNMPATVEGVENERQMHMALSLGAAAVQGYLISQPVPAGEIQQLLIAANSAGEEKPEIRFSA
jgi:diguanylate cyclase (GGDEF)-like protein